MANRLSHEALQHHVMVGRPCWPTTSPTNWFVNMAFGLIFDRHIVSTRPRSSAMTYQLVITCYQRQVQRTESWTWCPKPVVCKDGCLRQQQSPTNWFQDLMPRILPTTSPTNLIMNVSVANTLFFATDISNQTGFQPRDQQQVQRTESWNACRKKNKADNRPTTSASKLNH